MKTTHILLAAALATVASVLGAAPAAPNTHVEVIFDHPEKFTDVKDSDFASEKGRDSYLSTLKDFINERAPRHLAEGQTLTLTFSDIDMAGDFEPWRGPDFHSVRIVKDIYPPRMTFTYKLVDAAGAVVKEGQEKLIDMAFQMSASPINAQDPLRYEKDMLDNWLRDQFGRSKKTAASK